MEFGSNVSGDPREILSALSQTIGQSREPKDSMEESSLEDGQVLWIQPTSSSTSSILTPESHSADSVSSKLNQNSQELQETKESSMDPRDLLKSLSQK